MGRRRSANSRSRGNKMLIRGGRYPAPRIMTRTGKDPLRLGSDRRRMDVGRFLSEEWRFAQRFSRNGATQLALPFDTDQGPYQVAGETMQLELAPQRRHHGRREGRHAHGEAGR